MHLAESFALASGALLTKEKLYERFAPIGSEKFISFHKIHYNQYQEVLNLIKPVLKAYEIDVVQIGGENYPEIKSISKIKDYGCATYILRNSFLHFGEYSILFDLCASVNTKSLILNSISKKEFISPFFADSKNQIILDSYSENGSLPLYDGNATAHLVNKIKPEDIAENIFKLLEIKYKKPYETLYVGDLYKENSHEINIYPIKDYVYDLESISEPIIRMDYCYDLSFLEKHLTIKKCRVRTNKEIPLNFIKKYASKISSIDLELKSDEDFSSFISHIKSHKINLLLYSFLNEEKSGDLKLKYLDIEPISFQNIEDPTIKFNLNDENVYFKCNELILYKNKFYISKSDILNNNPYTINKFNKADQFDLSENLSNILAIRVLTNS